MEELARETFERLASEGVTITPLDAVRIDDAARRLRLSRHADGDPFLTAPRVRMVGGVVFHEPTIQSNLWLDEIAAEYARDDDTRFWFLAFALAHADEPGYFDRAELRKAQTVGETVRAFMRGISASLADVAAALDYCVNGDERDAEPTGPKEQARAQRAEATRRDRAWEALIAGIGATGAALDDLKRLTVPTVWKAVLRATELQHGRADTSATPAALAAWNELLLEIKAKAQSGGDQGSAARTGDAPESATTPQIKAASVSTASANDSAATASAVDVSRSSM